MARLRVPTVACVIGEGGSGGAIAIALADRVLMQENAIYSVISPEGCAAILWRDAGEARKAAAAFKPDAAHCLELGVIDAIVPGARRRGPERLGRGRRTAPGVAPRGAGRPRRDVRRRAGALAARQVPRDGCLRVTIPFLRGDSTLSTGFSPAETPFFDRLDTARKPEARCLQGGVPPSGPGMDPKGFAEAEFVPRNCPPRAQTRLRKTTFRAPKRPRLLPAKTRPEANARAVPAGPGGGPEDAAGSRSSSSSATTRAASTTTSGSSATARSPAGRSRRASRSSRGSVLAVHVEDHPSTTRPSRARSRRASTAPARSRSGNGARTSSSRRRRTAA